MGKHTLPKIIDKPMTFDEFKKYGDEIQKNNRERLNAESETDKKSLVHAN